MREQNNSPFVGKPVKMQQMRRDIGRRADRFGIAFNGPVVYPIDAAETANHVATVAAMLGWCPAFMRAAYDVSFVRAEDPSRRRCSRRSSRTRLNDASTALDSCAAEVTTRRSPAPAASASDLGSAWHSDQSGLNASQSRVNLSGMQVRAAVGSRRSDRPVADIGQRVD